MPSRGRGQGSGGGGSPVLTLRSAGAALGPLLAGLISPTGWNNVFYMLISADILACLVSVLGVPGWTLWGPKYGPLGALGQQPFAKNHATPTETPS